MTVDLTPAHTELLRDIRHQHEARLATVFYSDADCADGMTLDELLGVDTPTPQWARR